MRQETIRKIKTELRRFAVIKRRDDNRVIVDIYNPYWKPTEPKFIAVEITRINNRSYLIKTPFGCFTTVMDLSPLFS